LGIEKYNHVDGYDQTTLSDRKILFRLISVISFPLFEKMIITQLVNKFPVLMEPRDSLPFPQNPTTETYHEPVEFKKQLHVLFL